MIEYALESGRGARIMLASTPAESQLSPYLLGDDWDGSQIPTSQNRFAAGAGVGARPIASRPGEQDGTIHVGIVHPDRRERETLARALASLIRYRDDLPLPRVTATYESGETLEKAFMSAGSGKIVDTGDIAEILLDVTYPHPYWRSRTPVQFGVESGAGDALLPLFSYQNVVAAGADTTQLITNPGDVPVPAQWMLKGPAAAGAQVLVNGRGFRVGRALAASETITVTVTGEGVTVTDQTGTDRFTDLDLGAKFPWIPEGTSEITMRLDGAAQGASLVQASFYPEYEVTL